MYRLFILIFLSIFSNLYSQTSSINVNSSFFSRDGNLIYNKDLKVHAISNITFDDKSNYEMMVLKGKNWYYYSLLQKVGNYYKYIGTIALNDENNSCNNRGFSKIANKSNYFTIEHEYCNNDADKLMFYITFKLDTNTKNIYLHRCSAVVNRTQFDTDINSLGRKVLYDDVTEDLLVKLIFDNM